MDTQPDSPAVVRVLWITAAAAAIGFGTLYLYVACSRIGFPFDLEWGEGLFVDHVARVVRGQSIYVEPSINFVPLVYTPGYYYLAAGAALVFGVGIATLRAVSIGCSLALFGLLIAFGRRECGRTIDAVVLAGVVAGCYAISGAWLDIARVDALLLLLVFGAAFLVRHREGTASLIAAGALLAAAALTKQVALTLAPPVLLYAVIRHGRRGLVASASWAGALAVGIALLQRESHGWFLYYTFTVLSKAQTAWTERPMAFWTSDLFGRFPIGTAMGLAWSAIAWRFSAWRDWTFHVVFTWGVLMSTWEARIHPGAWFNTLIPALIVLALGMVRLARVVDLQVPGLGGGLVVAQLALLVYNPSSFIPGPTQWKAAADVVDLMRRVPGDVLFADHAWWSTLAGKRSHVHEMPMRDLFAAHDAWGDRLRDQVRRAIEAQQFDLIIQDSPDWFAVPLGSHYQPFGQLLPVRTALRQQVGNPIYPATVYLPRRRSVQWPPAPLAQEPH
ncbi:MAG: glycosyltransferase family 39 protein [Vicinamibacterales bacterium]